MTDAQKRAIKAYKEKQEFIQISVPAGQRQKYKDFAASQGYSLNALTVALWDAAIAGQIEVPPRLAADANPYKNT